MTTTWTGFKSGSTINLTLFSDPRSLGSVTVNAKEVAVKTVIIPADTKPGSHRLTGTGLAPDGRPLTESITIMVAGTAEAAEVAEVAEPGDSEPRLPYPGADLKVPVGIGAAALVLGGSVVFSVRRRKTSGPADR